MTDETDRPTSPGDEEAPAAASTEKWEGLIAEWTDCAKATLDRFSERAEENVKLARDGRYGLGAWLDDVKWFWDGVGEDASHLAATVQDSSVRPPRARTEGGR